MACAKASKHVLCIYFQNGTPKDSVSMITMNGKLYIHWRFIPSCHFMLQKFLVRVTRPPRPFWWDSIPLKNPRRKQNTHLQPLTLVFAKLWRRSKPELSRPHGEGCQWVGCWSLPDLLCQLHFSKSSSAIKKRLLKWEKGKKTLFVKAWDIICLGSWETYHPPGSTSASTKKLSILRIPKRLPRELMRLKVFVLRSNAFMAKLPS